MSTPTEPDWYALRKLSESTKSPAWRARHGEAAWETALVVSGELSREALRNLSAEERKHYALDPGIPREQWMRTPVVDHGDLDRPEPRYD